MGFLILCGAIAFGVQLAVLVWTAERYRPVRYLSLLLMAGLPLGGALYYAAAQPAVAYLGWTFDAALCLWAAGAVLVGGGAAWGIYALKAGRK